MPGARGLLDQCKGAAINKKFLFIVACLFGLVLGGELLLPVVEEVAILAFEWIEKTVDALYETVFDMASESAQKAGAWTLLFLFTGLLIWASYFVHGKYLQAKRAAPIWWAGKKSELQRWWSSLTITMKLAHIAGYLALVVILVLII